MRSRNGFSEQEFTTGELAIDVGPTGVFLVDGNDECEFMPDETVALLHGYLGVYLEHRKEEKRDARK